MLEVEKSILDGFLVQRTYKFVQSCSWPSLAFMELGQWHQSLSPPIFWRYNIQIVVQLLQVFWLARFGSLCSLLQSWLIPWDHLGIAWVLDPHRHAGVGLGVGCKWIFLYLCFKCPKWSGCIFLIFPNSVCEVAELSQDFPITFFHSVPHDALTPSLPVSNPWV